MKIAISGKGGVGKTMLAALLAREFVQHDFHVLAIDADPDANLASTLGFPHPEEIIPISEMKELIEERTGAKIGQSGSFYVLNPKVDDIPEKYAKSLDGIRLMVMGRVKRGGGGCYCPENSLVQTLMAHLLVARNEVVILDMAAGIEHLGRATAQAVEKFIVVVEPGRKSVETALQVKKLAADMGVKLTLAVGNKVRSEADQTFLRSRLPDFEFLGFIPYDSAITDAEISNNLAINSSPAVLKEVHQIYQRLTNSPKPGST
jgi:CO dehydrogenase maturation factor